MRLDNINKFEEANCRFTYLNVPSIDSLNACHIYDNSAYRIEVKDSRREIYGYRILTGGRIIMLYKK